LRANVRSQIGNAVPPPLAFSVGQEIIRSLRIADGELVADTVAEQQAPYVYQLPLLDTE
jgi:hypothetical protein